MKVSLLRTDKEITEIYERHVQTVWRVCYAYMKNTAETEDAVQDTFLRLMDANPSFESAEHEKAWLIRVCINLCKDHLKSSWSKKVVSENFLPPPAHTEEIPDGTAPMILDCVRRLPDNQKTAVYLFYYMDMPVSRIARAMNAKQNTVLSWLRRARKTLAKTIKEEF